MRNLSRASIRRRPFELASGAGLLLASLMAMPAAAQDEIERRGEREIVELHQFFQQWFNGELADSAAAFERFSGVMATEFQLVDPSGVVVELDPLQQGLRERNGAWAESPGRIWIEDVVPRWSGDGSVVLTYKEWQEQGGERSGRVSTVLFRQRAGTPNGLEWLHLHETWIDEK